MKFKSLAIILTILALGFCASDPSQTNRITTPQDMSLTYRSDTQTLFQTGIASWYGKNFHGRRTANGEIYDMLKLTAAHKTLPFNTFVEVRNLDNNHKIIVRINDRGPFVKNRIIDLSLKAARMIDMENLGTARVALKIVKPAQKIPDLHIRNTSQASFYLQAGAFSVKRNAYSLLKKVRRLMPELSFSIYFKNGFYKIISKQIPSRNKAETYQNTLLHHKIEAFIKEYQ